MRDECAGCHQIPDQLFQDPAMQDVAWWQLQCTNVMQTVNVTTMHRGGGEW